MFRVRVLATQEKIALIAKAARKQGVSVSHSSRAWLENLAGNSKATTSSGLAPHPSNRQSHYIKSRNFIDTRRHFIDERPTIKKRA